MFKFIRFSFLNFDILGPLLHKVLTVILIGLFFLITYNIYEKVIYTFSFTDEGDNISIGKFILMDKVLYSEVFSQHQPLTYFISAGLQKITKPDNLLLVVRRHRQFVILFSFCWISFLVFKFGIKYLPFFAVIELLKYYFLGHLFLAESLVIYPLIYLFLLATVQFNKKIDNFDLILASLTAFFIIFNLLPAILAVLAIFAFFINKLRRDLKRIFFLIVPAIILTFIMFLFIPLKSYLDSTIWSNVFYYIPKSTSYAFQIDQSQAQIIIHAIFQPFIYLLNNDNFGFFLTQKTLAFIWIISLILFLLATRKVLFSLMIICLLTIINPRPAFGSLIFYHIFHSLPYFAFYIISIALFIYEIWKSKISFKFKLIPLFMFFVLLISLLFDKSLFYFTKINQQETAYVNFARIFTYSDAIKNLSTSSDTLAVMPYEELLYWNTNLHPPTRFLFYLSWVMDVPKYRQEISQEFKKHPPTFVFWQTTFLEPYLSTDDYINLIDDKGKRSALFIHKSKIERITDKQWENIKRHNLYRI